MPDRCVDTAPHPPHRAQYGPWGVKDCPGVPEYVEQPMPVPNDRPSIQSMVRADLERREQVGIQRYGTSLQPFNGRDTLRDLYEELLDATCYVRQLIEERDEAAHVRSAPAREVAPPLLSGPCTCTIPGTGYDVGRVDPDCPEHGDKAITIGQG